MSHVTEPTFLDLSLNLLFLVAYIINPDITPLLRLGVSTSQLGLLGVLAEEVLEQCCHVHKILMRFPGVFLHRVSCPFYQVLHPMSHLLDIEDRLNFILQVVVINSGRGRGRLVLGGE